MGMILLIIVTAIVSVFCHKVYLYSQINNKGLVESGLYIWSEMVKFPLDKNIKKEKDNHE